MAGSPLPVRSGTGPSPKNKLLDQIIRTPDRMPSPQPTHLNAGMASHKILQEPGSGYVAQEFEGKHQQMEQ